MQQLDELHLQYHSQHPYHQLKKVSASYRAFCFKLAFSKIRNLLSETTLETFQDDNKKWCFPYFKVSENRSGLSGKRHVKLLTDPRKEMLTWPLGTISGFTCWRQLHITNSETSRKITQKRDSSNFPKIAEP